MRSVLHRLARPTLLGLLAAAFALADAGVATAQVAPVPAPVPDAALTALHAFLRARLGGNEAHARAHLTPELRGDPSVGVVASPGDAPWIAYAVVATLRPAPDTVVATVSLEQAGRAGQSPRHLDQAVTLRQRGGCWWVAALGPLQLAAAPPPAAVAGPLPPLAFLWEDRDCAWAIVRARFPAAVPVYRPTWLPERFRAKVWPPAPGPFFGVTYTSAPGDALVVAFGPVNSAPPLGVQPVAVPVTVHGVPGWLSAHGGTPAIQVQWEEHGLLYSVRGEHGPAHPSSLTRDELQRIVASLAPVGPDGRVPPGVPAAGHGGMSRPAARSRDGVLVLGLVAGLLLLAGALAMARRRATDDVAL